MRLGVSTLGPTRFQSAPWLRGLPRQANDATRHGQGTGDVACLPLCLPSSHRTRGPHPSHCCRPLESWRAGLFGKNQIEELPETTCLRFRLRVSMKIVPDSRSNFPNLNQEIGLTLWPPLGCLSLLRSVAERKQGPLVRRATRCIQRSV